MSLVTRLLELATTQADADAVVARDVRHSYGELRSLCLRVACYLREQGLQPGDRVALILPNSFEYIAVFYAIWAAGGVTVALNTQAKAKDLLNWVKHSGASRLIAETQRPEIDQLHELLGDDIPVLRVPVGREESRTDRYREWQDLLALPEHPAPVNQSDDRIASIIYTSGTTGSPKGVTLTHRNLQTNTDSILKYLCLSASDSIVNVLPFYYSYGNSIIHTHLATGGKLVLENSLLYPHQVMRRIETERATGFSGVPSTYSLLINRVNLNEFDLSSLRYITQAGGPMAPTITDKLTRALPDTDIFIMYGQTEASARLSYLPPADLQRKRGSIGIAIPGVTLEIRDKTDQPVKAGDTGEICARGANIMQGYWKDPEASRKVLKGGWLHTGDLAHADSDGYLYIDGRSSDIIKSGGNRISPQEIEEVIQELESVMDVAVIGLPDELLGEVILALVVPHRREVTEKMAIMRHCKQRLSAYKLPKAVEFIDFIPRTSSGKIQRFILEQRYRPENPHQPPSPGSPL